MLKNNKALLREEGLISCIKNLALFLKHSCSLQFRTYYIYENTLSGPDIDSKVKDVSLKIISTPEEFDELAAKDFVFSSWEINLLKSKAALKAISFCVFIGKDLAHVTWVAFNENARKAVDPFPVKIDWQTEAWSGSSRTREKFQRMGIYSYVYSEIFRYLREIGRVRDKFTIEKSNKASQHNLAKFSSKVIAEGWYLKIFFIKFWKEKHVEC